MGIDEFLIAAQFGSMIASDALQVVGGLVLVEGRGGEVEHTEVGSLFRSDRLLAHAGRDEHAVVEIALVDLPHIDQTEHHQTGGHQLYTYLLILIEQEEEGADDDNPERAPAVGSEHRHAHLSEILH